MEVSRILENESLRRFLSLGAMTSGTDLPAIPFASPEAWRAWLADEHSTSDGIWLQIAKKGSGVDSVTHDQAVEVALCFGWIDGQARKLDDTYWLQRFTPRRARSRWSRINRDRATALIETGEMQPAGLREIERAKADGRWDAAYESQSAATVPDDLREALERNAGAGEFFATLNSSSRYAILHRIQEAKKPETRARRIEKYVAMLSEHKKIYP
jgi:uncharacterized protein YdeI (YjbR/CyaY-like superfamily)